MTEVRIEVAEDHHVDQLSPLVREQDAQEMWVAFRKTPEAGLRLSLHTAMMAWAGYIDDEIVCMFGISPSNVLLGRAAPWFVASEGITQHQVAFLRRCKPIVSDMLDMYPHLENWVWEDNRLAKRWLRWLGFELQAAEPFGFERRPFHRFEMRAHRNVY